MPPSAARPHAPTATALTWIRSLAFNLAFYLTTAVMLIACLPLLLLPRRYAMVPFRWHAQVCTWLLGAICGVRFEVRGRENIPDGAALIAAKHQSAWDTFGLVPLFRDPCYVLKAELGSIPLYGQYSAKFGMIFLPREKKAIALRQLLEDARDRAAQGRQIIIFPEGSRREPGAEPDYKPGVAAIYGALNLPCVPIALNSGLVWPRRQFLRHPGTIVVDVLPPMPAGLPRAVFMSELQTRIETATAALVAERT